MTARSGRPPPDPGLSPVVELLCHHLHRTLDFAAIGKALARERIATKQTPPAHLEVEPAGTLRNEDVLDARVPSEPVRVSRLL